MRKLLIAGIALVIGAVVVFPVFALPSVNVTTEVLGAHLVGSCSNGTQTWEVPLSVSVENTSEESAVLESTNFFAKFSQPGNTGQVNNDITIVDAGGFVPGASTDPGTTSTYDPVVQTSIPCDATNASMFAALEIVGRDKIYLDGDAFIAEGTPVPNGATGVFGIAVLLGVAGVLAQRLGRRSRPLTVGAVDR
jgi:hypothetical protein